MKKTISFLVAGICLVALTAGCYHTVEGQSKVGVPFTKDRIVSRYERTVDQLFDAAKKTLAFKGTLTGENTIAKTLVAKVDNNTVWVKVSEAEPGITEVTTQARGKGGGANITLSSEIDKMIALQLQAGN
ncbi:MAG: hypothetical protein ABSC03_12050 [Verrucomicrobiota bacterium]|jgi:nicotinate-nucleotide pyrophosphorylase